MSEIKERVPGKTIKIEIPKLTEEELGLYIKGQAIIDKHMRDLLYQEGLPDYDSLFEENGINYRKHKTIEGIVSDWAGYYRPLLDRFLSQKKGLENHPTTLIPQSATVSKPSGDQDFGSVIDKCNNLHTTQSETEHSPNHPRETNIQPDEFHAAFTYLAELPQDQLDQQVFSDAVGKALDSPKKNGERRNSGATVKGVSFQYVKQENNLILKLQKNYGARPYIVTVTFSPESELELNIVGSNVKFGKDELSKGCNLASKAFIELSKEDPRKLRNIIYE